ncbi:hypothetical protein HBH96_010910 [Parastagonospora nodorum]|nr:hypothetical protein HBH96_010910 [Parastagonospora nodorum]
MHVSILLTLVAWITVVVSDTSHVRQEVAVHALLTTKNSTDSTLGKSSTSHGLPKPNAAWFKQPPPVADEATWSRAVCKGTKMMAQMSYSDYDVGQLLAEPKDSVQSPWSLADLDDWGYKLYPARPVYCDYSTGGFWGISNFLQNQGITDKCSPNGKEGEWRAQGILHYDPDPEDFASPFSQEYQDPWGIDRRVTEAHFFMSVLAGAGIIAQDRQSPWESLKKLHPTDADPDELPMLQRSSDMMWIMWENTVEFSRRHELKLFLSLSIKNPETQALIQHALSDVGKELTVEPVEFKTTTPQGKALLSSANGSGFAHFLIQRKLQVGLKSIDRVLVFQGESKSKAPCLMFGVVNLSAPTPRPRDDTTKDPAAGPGSDPNDTEMTEEPDDPDLLPEGGNVGAWSLQKRSFVRVHTFRLNERGNVTLSSS